MFIQNTIYHPQQQRWCLVVVFPISIWIIEETIIRTDVMVRDMYMIMWQLKYDITKIFFLYKFHFFISCFLSLFAFPFFVQKNIASYAEFVCLNKYFFDDLGLEHRDLEESIDTNCFLNKTLISHLCTSYFYYNVNVHFA